MKPGPKHLLVSMSVAAVVAACTQTAGPPAAGAAGVTATAAAGGCSGEIGRFRAVIDSDNATGNVNASVYERMAADVDRAASACATGRDGEAHASLTATKRRYGYP